MSEYRPSSGSLTEDQFLDEILANPVLEDAMAVTCQKASEVAVVSLEGVFEVIVREMLQNVDLLADNETRSQRMVQMVQKVINGPLVSALVETMRQTMKGLLRQMDSRDNRVVKALTNMLCQVFAVVRVFLEMSLEYNESQNAVSPGEKRRPNSDFVSLELLNQVGCKGGVTLFIVRAITTNPALVGQMTTSLNHILVAGVQLIDAVTLTALRGVKDLLCKVYELITRELVTLVDCFISKTQKAVFGGAVGAIIGGLLGFIVGRRWALGATTGYSIGITVAYALQDMRSPLRNRLKEN